MYHNETTIQLNHTIYSKKRGRVIKALDLPETEGVLKRNSYPKKM